MNNEHTYLRYTYNPLPPLDLPFAFCLFGTRRYVGTLGWSKNGGKNDFFEIFKSYPLNLFLTMRNASCENFIKIGQL